MEDAGIDSVQKEIIAARACFLAAYLESLETEAIEGKQIDFGTYTHCVNSLRGVLKQLGFEKKLKVHLTELDSYIAGKTYPTTHRRRRKKA